MGEAQKVWARPKLKPKLMGKLGAKGASYGGVAMEQEALEGSVQISADRKLQKKD